MKNTKFKVYDYDSKTMYNQEDLIITFDSIGEDVYVYKDGKVEPLYRYELLPYIRLKDEDVEEVYEGAIVEVTIIDKFDEIEKSVGVVMYDEDDFSWLIRELDDSYWYLNEYPSSEGKRILKIIGNVYENPELLEE